jgi:putative ABC transport system permease protein
MLRDFRFGLRILRRHPSYACAAIAVMALGVGATTAVFSVLRGVLITPLPYREPSRLVLFRADLPGVAHEAALTSDEYHALKSRTDLFEHVAAAVETDGNLTTPDDMAPLNAVAVTDNFLETLGVVPALGRSLRSGDGGPGGRVAIAYDVWQRHFRGDASIVGQTIEINNGALTVAGVLPRGFKAYLGAGVALPIQMDVLLLRGKGYDDDPFRGNVVIARLKRGVGIEAAGAALDALAKNVVRDHPSQYATGPVRLSVSALDAEVVKDARPALVAAAGAVAFVLIVACANLTNLLLARASARTREMAVRVSVGASRADIVRQLVTEGLVVGAAGAAGGWLLAQWGVEGLLLLAPAALPRRETIAVDGTIALFAVGLAVACAIVVSLVPAWHATRASVSGGMKEDSARTGGVTRGVLVAAQLALSVVLLVGAGLMGRAFVSMRSVPLGFDPHRAASLYISLSARRFGTGGTLDEVRARQRGFYEQLVDQVRDIPGVQQVGVGFPVPLTGVLMHQRVTLGPGVAEHDAEGFTAYAGYLSALDVPLVAGRYFARADDEMPLVIVDERLAAQLWPHESAVGRRLQVVNSVSPPRWVEVVGIVAHVQSQSPRAAGLPQVWMTPVVRAYAQQNMVVRAHAGADPIGAMPAVARAAQQLGSGRPVRDIRLLDDYVSDASADTRFALFVFGIFAVLAVVLAGVGVYGVVAYAMALRTREFAVRLALGASPRRLVALVLRDGAAWTVLGLAAGLAGAAILTRYLESLLFRVGAHDAVTFVAVALLLAAVALAASVVPALRATRVDPMRALRSE